MRNSELTEMEVAGVLWQSFGSSKLLAAPRLAQQKRSDPYIQDSQIQRPLAEGGRPLLLGKAAAPFQQDNRMRTVRTTVLSALLLTLVCQISLAQTKPTNPEPLSQVVEKHFAHWDRDHNNVLDLAEIDHVIADHSVHGRLAALVVSLR